MNFRQNCSCLLHTATHPSVELALQIDPVVIFAIFQIAVDSSDSTFYLTM